MVALTGSLTLAFNFLRSLTPAAKLEAREIATEKHSQNIAAGLAEFYEKLYPNKEEREAREEFFRRSNAEYIANGHSCFHRQEAKKTAKPRFD